MICIASIWVPMNPFDFETTNCSATIQKSLDDSPHEGNPLFMSNILNVVKYLYVVRYHLTGLHNTYNTCTNKHLGTKVIRLTLTLVWSRL